MPNTVTHKLELFQEAILAKAAAEKEAVVQATERMKQAELDKEENRLLGGLYQQIQNEIQQIKTENVKEISQNALRLKKRLYQQREQYLSEIIARARAELAGFAKGPDYPAYLERQAKKLSEECGGRFSDAALLVRPQDMQFAEKIRAAYGGGCMVEQTPDIQLGGIFLRSASAGVEIDRTLDGALAQQREWFYSHSNFHLE